MRKNYPYGVNLDAIPLDELIPDLREGRLGLPTWAYEAATRIGHQLGKTNGDVRTNGGIGTDQNEIRVAKAAVLLATSLYRNQTPKPDRSGLRVVRMTFQSQATMDLDEKEICELSATLTCKGYGWSVHSGAWYDLARHSTTADEYLLHRVTKLFPHVVKTEFVHEMAEAA